jgi:hypothetical protein
MRFAVRSPKHNHNIMRYLWLFLRFCNENCFNQKFLRTSCRRCRLDVLALALLVLLRPPLPAPQSRRTRSCPDRKTRPRCPAANSDAATARPDEEALFLQRIYSTKHIILLVLVANLVERGRPGAQDDIRAALHSPRASSFQHSDQTLARRIERLEQQHRQTYHQKHKTNVENKKCMFVRFTLKQGRSVLEGALRSSGSGRVAGSEVALDEKRRQAALAPGREEAGTEHATARHHTTQIFERATSTPCNTATTSQTNYLGHSLLFYLPDPFRRQCE